MNDSGSDCVLEDYSDAERLRVIRAVWLGDLPMDVAFSVIGNVAFDGMKEAGK
jgi:hypothetical protein